ncbi:hypothetical protein [Methylobacterium sp. WCS2018Hpa-22]|uniref:hypothetical protein n=1 Tax=Methylobacterium sp. WCS2018Hpa-22 TaxID=3073633 RepID=UPI00288B5E6A|nr:hypothetical protein [Methylobacterium sp. WCS2018Hpa-22]
MNQIEAAIAVASSTALVELNRVIWSGLSSGALSEDDAQRLAEAIHMRQTVAKTLREPVGGATRPATLFSPRRTQRPPVRSVAIERRRRLAASGPLPPALAARFTTGEAAVLRIVGDECRDKGRCVLPLDAIAARAGVGRTTAQKAMREAKRLGLVNIEERRQTGAKNLPNRVTVVDREWSSWLARSPKRGIGFGKVSTTETQVLSGSEKAASLRQNRSTQPRFVPYKGTYQKPRSHVRNAD